MFTTTFYKCLTPLALLALAGCATDYRVVKTSDMDWIEQCAVASEHNHFLLTQQSGELADHMARVSEQLNHNRQALSQLQEQREQCRSDPSDDDADGDESETDEQEQPALDKQVVGLTEPVRFEDLRLTLPALLNTSIEISLLDARDIQPFERNGKDWVRFTLPLAEGAEPGVVERRLQKRLAEKGAHLGQPVVRLRFKVGELSQTSDFALVDRAGQDYPVVLGRLAIRDLMIVDVSQRNAPPREKPQEPGDDQ